MTVRKLKVKGEKLSFLAHADSAEKLVTGATTGATPTTWNFKVKGTYIYWVDDDGNERRKEGTTTGGSLTASRVKVKGAKIYYGDYNGDERSFGAEAITETLSPTAGAATYHLGDYAQWDVYYGAAFSASRTRIAQRMNNFSGTITDVWFYLARTTATGDVTARIRRVSDDSIIATSPDVVDAADLNDPPSSGSIRYKKFTFPSTVISNEDVRFCLEFAGGGGLNFAYSQTDVMGGGYSQYLSGTWYDSSLDLCFVINSYLKNGWDGDTGTYTECPKAEYTYLVHWDLGQVKTINTIRLYWGVDAIWRPHRYTLAVSLDGLSWTTVALMNEGKPDSGWKSYTFSSESCRYIRFTTGASFASDLGTRIYEVEVEAEI